MGILSDRLKHCAHAAGGSFKTRSDRVRTAGRLAFHLRQENINIERVEHLKQKHIITYVESRLTQGCALRTVANEMSAIRKVLQRGGCHALAKHPAITNEALGLSGATRIGKKRPMPHELFENKLCLAKEQDVGIAACLLLAKSLGLRREEVVQSYKSFATWSQFLKNGAQAIPIIYGTKGGRSRMVTTFDQKELEDALAYAISIAKQRKGYLIVAAGLKEALKYFDNAMKKFDITGEYSFHSIRYSFAVKAINANLAMGYSLDEALAKTSMDLGHGDGRGRYIKSVYGRELFPPQRHNRLKDRMPSRSRWIDEFGVSGYSMLLPSI